MNDVSTLIGKNIKISRVIKGWSQAELAHKLDVEQSYISRIESASVAASCERIYEIIHLLNCESTDIFPSADQVKTKHSEI
ncbi:helix-turn-helix domain-containing protein [Pseudoalteromonas agarivorans]|uniref:XRE family transcriptional regulator n=1 Tax=Pseudoalteromonas agarivorans TaxID=176102 RepID=A0AAD0U0N7_9GAMM|nr:helix-turn-helix transcriptional regulator [Pseudoalteromonas agarivorans]AYM86856.1 XRE family transcriptional regulator [Pseudoalteromonas agarivorans]